MNFAKSLYKPLAERVGQVGLETSVTFAGALLIWSQFLGNVGFDLDDANVWVPLLEVIGPCVRPVRTRYINLGENQDDLTIRESGEIRCQRWRVVKERAARVQ